MFTYGLDNGNNFRTITTANNEIITSVSITAANGFTDLKQPRVSFAGAAVPEPASLGLAGTGFLGLVAAQFWRRRRSRHA